MYVVMYIFKSKSVPLLHSSNSSQFIIPKLDLSHASCLYSHHHNDILMELYKLAI